MKDKQKQITKILIIIVMLCVFINLIRLMFLNPDMTETRFVMTFWKEYVISTILVIGGYFLLIKLEK